MREREATKACVKEHKAFQQLGSLIDGCREWERQWERLESHQPLFTLWTYTFKSPCRYIEHTWTFTCTEDNPFTSSLFITAFLQALTLPYLQICSHLFKPHKTSPVDTSKICLISSAPGLMGTRRKIHSLLLCHSLSDSKLKAWGHHLIALTMCTKKMLLQLIPLEHPVPLAPWQGHPTWERGGWRTAPWILH